MGRKSPTFNVEERQSRLTVKLLRFLYKNLLSVSPNIAFFINHETKKCEERLNGEGKKRYFSVGSDLKTRKNFQLQDFFPFFTPKPSPSAMSQTQENLTRKKKRNLKERSSDFC